MRPFSGILIGCRSVRTIWLVAAFDNDDIDKNDYGFAVLVCTYTTKLPENIACALYDY